MKVVDIYSYVYFGTNIWYLQSLDHGNNIETKDGGGIRPNLENLIQGLENFGFPVTRRAAFNLEEFCREAFEGKQNEDTLSKEQVSEIRRLASALRPTFDAEAAGLSAYILTEKRYPLESLTADPWKLFAEHVKLRLADVAVLDIEEAAKCIAFQRSTAAAFHLMRATESTLKEFYCHNVKRNRSDLMWGPMISSLRSRKGIHSGALIDHLDNLRRNFRNPTQHPEKIYDLTEVQDLFGVCIDVINRMTSTMPVRLNS